MVDPQWHRRVAPARTPPPLAESLSLDLGLAEDVILAAERQWRRRRRRRPAGQEMPLALVLRTYEAVLAVREHQARLNWNLLENSARLRIATFDSFCGSLVRRLPLLSGLGAAAPVSDSEALYREAILELFRQLDEPSCPPPLREALESLLRYGSNRIETLQPLLSALLAKRDQWQEDILGADLEVMDAALTALVSEAFHAHWSRLQAFGVEELFEPHLGPGRFFSRRLFAPLPGQIRARPAPADDNE